MTETETTQEGTQVELTAGATNSGDLYEQLRDSAPREAAVEWRDGDRWAAHLRESFRELAADESLRSRQVR